MQRPRKPPSRWWYAFGVLPIVVGGAFIAVSLVDALEGLGDSLEQIELPGQKELHLELPGKYTVFYEHFSNVEGRIYDTGREEISGLDLSLISRATGGEIPLTSPGMSSTYSLEGRSGVAVSEFTIEEPGWYEFSGVYSEPRPAPQVVFAIGREFEKELIRTLLLMFAVMGGAALLGVGLWIWVYLKRKRFRESMSRGE